MTIWLKPADHVMREAEALGHFDLRLELRDLAHQEMAGHDCTGYGCMTCWAAAVMLAASKRLTNDTPTPDGLPVPPGHWLDPNAGEAWRDYWKRIQQDETRRLGDAVR